MFLSIKSVFPPVPIIAGMLAVRVILPLAAMEIKPGDDAFEVMAELGEPSGEIRIGGKIVYTYPQGSLHVKDGVVVQVSDGFTGSGYEITRKTASGESVRLSGGEASESREKTKRPVPDSPGRESGEISFWTVYPERAKEASASSGKPLLMLFIETDGNARNEQLESVLQSETFRQFALARVVPLRMEYVEQQPYPPERSEQITSLRDKWQVGELPMIVMIDPAGHELGRTGYSGGKDADAFVSELESIIGADAEEKAVSNGVRDLLGDDLADALEQIEFINQINGGALSLSLQILLGTILSFYVLRRLMKR